jgi:hypothetical protein
MAADRDANVLKSRRRMGRPTFLSSRLCSATAATRYKCPRLRGNPGQLYRTGTAAFTLCALDNCVGVTAQCHFEGVIVRADPGSERRDLVVQLCTVRETGPVFRRSSAWRADGAAKSDQACHSADGRRQIMSSETKTGPLSTPEALLRGPARGARPSRPNVKLRPNLSTA